MVQYLKLLVEIASYLIILALSIYLWILSLDPYGTPEHNFALFLFSILVFGCGVWRFMTRKEKLWIWEIF